MTAGAGACMGKDAAAVPETAVASEAGGSSSGAACVEMSGRQHPDMLTLHRMQALAEHYVPA